MMTDPTFPKRPLLEGKWYFTLAWYVLAVSTAAQAAHALEHHYDWWTSLYLLSLAAALFYWGTSSMIWQRVHGGGWNA